MSDHVSFINGIIKDRISDKNRMVDGEARTSGYTTIVEFFKFLSYVQN